MRTWLQYISSWIFCPATDPVVPDYLVNREYYDAIDRKMAALPQPTVQDAIDAMLEQANGAYVKHSWRGDGGRSYIHRRVVEDHFKPNDPKHEIPHLTCRRGHTPQQEQYVLPFTLGLWLGLDVEGLESRLDDGFDGMKNVNMHEYLRDANASQTVPVLPASKVDWTIQFAAGLYLRTKIDRFKQADMLQAPYAEQLAFCHAHADTDETPAPSYAEFYEADDILQAPYDLIKLSHEEWRSIIAVATGLREPKDTSYPQRLTAVQKTLEYTRLQQDIKPRFTDLATKNAQGLRR